MLTPLRMALLLVIALAGGAFMGALSGLAFFAPAGLIVGGILGLMIGFISLAIVAPALAHKDLIAGVALMYPLPGIVALATGVVGPDAAIPATGAVLALCALGTHLFLKEEWPHATPGRCRACDYDVEGITHRCPECGTKVTPTGKPRRYNPVSVVWLSLVSALLVTLAVVTVPPAFERAGIGFVSSDPERLMELMGDNEMTVHDRAARRLRDIAPDLLATRALVHPDHGTRRQAARMLRSGFEHDPVVFHALVRALNDPNDYVRYEVAISLGAIANPEALPALRLAATTDPSAMVARAALDAITEIEGTPPLSRPTSDPQTRPPTSDR